MAGKQKTIELDDLTIGYVSRKQRKIVGRHISSTIFSGELTCLLGSNGVGKSTLLRTLTGFQPKLSGEIRIEGREIADFRERELSRRIGVVLTEKFEIPNMTVRSLIGMGRSPYTGFWGTLGPEDQAMVNQAISLIKIEELADRMVNTLSDGERQKVMIAKALAQQTPIILLDEPTAFLDFPSKVEIMRILHQLSRQTGKTIFLSTHDLELALQMADKIWLMDREKEMHTGTPEDLALDGSLSHFFARKGIIFDQQSGLFRVESTFDREIQVIGHGQRYAMIRKALSRNGIRICKETVTDFRIEIREEMTLFFPDGSSRVVSNIEELLSYLTV